MRVISILYTLVFLGLALVWTFFNHSYGRSLRARVVETILQKHASDSLRLRRTAVMPGVAIEKLAPIFSQQTEYASDDSAVL